MVIKKKLMKKINRCCAITNAKKVCKNSKSKGYIYCNIHNNEKPLCSICLDHYKRPKTLQCSHKFCLQCISKWIYLEHNETCPLCRNIVTGSEENDAFEYCYNTKLITKIVFYEYILDILDTSNEVLVDFVTRVLNFDSDYTYTEWKSFKEYLLTNPEMHQQFYSLPTIHYTYYQRFDENNQGIIDEHGRSVLYIFKINEF